MTGSMTKVVQITNIAPQATKDQMASLFGSIGKIDDLRLYPTIRDVSCPVVSRICYVKFLDQGSVAVAQHMSNTVFIDRALVVIPVHSGQIPDEFKAIEAANNGTLVPGLQPTGSKLPPECINRIEGCAPNQVITTSDPKLELNELPKYPSLPVNFDARRIEETRRTILVLDVKPSWTVDELMEFFESVGEVKYGRMAEKDQSNIVMIEFSEQKSVVDALKLQGTDYKGEPLNLYHSTEPITKPQTKTNEAAQKEIEEAMSIVKETQSMISAVIDPMIGISMLTKEKAPVIPTTSRRRSRSRSREARRNRDRSRNRSRRSRSRSHSRRSRSRSRSKRSRSRRRSVERSSRSKRSRSRDRRRKSKSRHRSRSRSRDRRANKRRNDKRNRRGSRSRSRSRRSRSKDRKSKRRSPDYNKKIKRDYDDEERIGQDGSVPREIRKRARTPSPKSEHMDLSSP